MIKITNLTLRNFLSVGNVTQAIKLDAAGLTLILGSNTDANGGTTRNGAGKTSVLQAISFGLFGWPLTQIKKDNLVNNINGKGMLVTIEFEKDGKKYRIERGRKPTFLRFFVSDKQVQTEEDEAQGENKQTQAEIERIIGMGYTMFRHIVAINTFTDPFLRMKAAEQREVIEELLGVSQISQRAETLKRLIGETKDRLRDGEAQIKATVEANTRIETAIARAEVQRDAWQTTHDARIAELTTDILAVDEIDYDAELLAFDTLDAYVERERGLRARSGEIVREIDHLKRTLRGHEAALAQAVSDGRADVSKQIARLKSEIARKEAEAASKREAVQRDGVELEAIVAQIDAPDQHHCSTCGQGISGTDHLETVLANLTRRRAEIAARIARDEADILRLLSEAETCVKEIAEVEAAARQKADDAKTRIEAAKTLVADVKVSIEAQEDKKRDVEAEIAMLGPRPSTAFSNRDEVYAARSARDMLVRDLEQEMAKVNPKLAEIEGLRETLQAVDYDVVNDLNTLLKHQDFLLRLLTSKDSFIRKKIIDQNLAYLNTRMNYYLDKLGLPHEVKFNSDLTVSITQLGRDFDFEQLSRGEMGRVIMATSWSFRDVWESLNTSVNLLFVDEMLDNGLDDNGAEAALDVLKKMSRERAKNVFLISHKDNLISRVSRILLVHKENGFTRFEEDATI